MAMISASCGRGREGGREGGREEGMYKVFLSLCLYWLLLTEEEARSGERGEGRRDTHTGDALKQWNGEGKKQYDL